MSYIDIPKKLMIPWLLFPHVLQGWSPEPEEYNDLPQRSPEGHTGSTQNPYLQIDLLKPFNITGNNNILKHQFHVLNTLKILILKKWIQIQVIQIYLHP